VSARESLPDLTTQLNPEQVFALIDRVLPFEVCLYHQVLPLDLDGDHIRLGVAELNSEGLAYVQNLLSHLNYQVEQELVPVTVQQQLLSAFLNYDRQLKAAGHVGPVDRSQPRPITASNPPPNHPGRTGAAHPSSMARMVPVPVPESDLEGSEVTQWTDDPLSAFDRTADLAADFVADRSGIAAPVIEYSDWMEAASHEDPSPTPPVLEIHPDDPNDVSDPREAADADDADDATNWLGAEQLPTVMAPLSDRLMTDAISEPAVLLDGSVPDNSDRYPDSSPVASKGEVSAPQSPSPTTPPLRSDSSPPSTMDTLTEHPVASALASDPDLVPMVDEPAESDSHRRAIEAAIWGDRKLSPADSANAGSIDPESVSDLGAMTISPPPDVLAALTEAANHELPAELAQLEQDLVKALEQPASKARPLGRVSAAEIEAAWIQPTVASPLDYGALHPQALVLQTRYADRPLSELGDLPPRALIQELLQRAIEGGIGRLYFDRPERDRARILCSRDGILQAALDPLRPSTFQGAIDELKLLADLPLLPPVGKARQVEIERTYRNELLLLRLRIAPGRLGEEATLQVLRGAALKFHQRQQLAKLGHDAIDLTRQLQKKLAEMQARAALSPDVDPRLKELTHLQSLVQSLIERLAGW
jgi:hypothetical protein